VSFIVGAGMRAASGIGGGAMPGPGGLFRNRSSQGEAEREGERD